MPLISERDPELDITLSLSDTESRYMCEDIKHKTETKNIIHNKCIFKNSTIMRQSAFCLSLCPADLYYVFMDHM